MVVVKKEVYTVYAERDDMTFIMEDSYNEYGDVETHVKGFHYGEPNENSITFYYGDL